MKSQTPESFRFVSPNHTWQTYSAHHNFHTQILMNFCFALQTFLIFPTYFFRPKNKFIRITKDENFSSDLHYLSNTPAMAKASCSYDLDPVDEAWLNILNGERTKAGSLAVTEEQFERVIEELEVSTTCSIFL